MTSPNQEPTEKPKVKPKEKYLVFKNVDLRDGLDRYNDRPDINNLLIALDKAQVHDAVVIRKQDVFAPPALETYANSILTAIEALKVSGTDAVSPTIKRLQEIADYFHTQAEDSWLTPRKLPS